MNTAPLPESSVAVGALANHGYVRRIRAVLQALKRLVKKQGQAFPAAALAEAGDVEGAVELLDRCSGKKS